MHDCHHPGRPYMLRRCLQSRTACYLLSMRGPQMGCSAIIAENLTNNKMGDQRIDGKLHSTIVLLSEILEMRIPTQSTLSHF